MERTPIQVCALYEQVGKGARTSDLPHLGPEPALDDRAMEVQHTFPLDNGLCPDEVVTGRKRREFDTSAEVPQ